MQTNFIQTLKQMESRYKYRKVWAWGTMRVIKKNVLRGAFPQCEIKMFKNTTD